MKKLTIAILVMLALTLTGCKGQTKTQQQIDTEISGRITKFNYEGHKYLLYKQSYSKGGLGGMVHDPDCPCREKGAVDD